MSRDRSTNNSSKLTISLVENGLHSLRNGITSFDRYIQKKEESKKNAKSRFLLRDSVMMLHHGVELLMKEILVRKSEFLIFEKLDDAASKQKLANAQGVGIFSLKNPPKTVTYEEAINRVEAFVKPDQLTSQLRDKLSLLNSLRNQLEHYAIDINEDDVIQLVGSIREPLFELLQDALGKDVRPESRQVEMAWARIEDRARFGSRAEEEVFNVLSVLGAATIPGHLLNAEDEITLPTLFSPEGGVQMYSLDTVGYIPDFVGKVNESTWVIEVKGFLIDENLLFERMAGLRSEYGLQPWVIVLDRVSVIEKAQAKEYGLYITDKNSWEKIKDFIPKQGSLFEGVKP